MEDLSFLKHLSYSNLNQFHQCRRCWFLKYKYKYELPPSENMELGSEVHTCIENYHNGVAQDLSKELHYFVGSGSKKRLKWEYTLESFLSPYSEYYLPEHFDSIEGFVKAKIERKNGVLRTLPIPLLGKIDRVWKKVPHDVKTSGHRFYDRDTEDRKQHGLYVYLLYKTYGYIPDRFIYDVLVKNKTPVVQIVELPMTPEIMWEAVDYIFDTWEEMKVAEMPDYHTDECWNKDVMP